MAYLIGGIIVIAVIAFFYVWAKKDADRLSNYIAELTEEQKKTLEATEIEEAEGGKYAWIQDGMICDAIVKNESKVALVVLWYNKVIQNNTLNQIQHADINMKKADFDKHGLKKGDFVKIYIDPEKGAKIVFD